MKKIIFFIAVSLFVMPLFAEVPAGRSRPSINSQVLATAPRVTVSAAQLSAPPPAPPIAESVAVNPSNTPVVFAEPLPAPVQAVDMREKEKAACLSNNLGIGNTFVWASRYGDTSNYSFMVEDVENPENNACFVRVSLKSDDPKIKVSDFPAQYYEIGRSIVCGSWVDEGTLKKRILDAKKSARTWETIAGGVGGAGIGVGSMELFGNKLIKGKVQGQKDERLTEKELIRSQLLALKSKNRSAFDDYMRNLKKLSDACEDEAWNAVQAASKPNECDEIDYKYLLNDTELKKL